MESRRETGFLTKTLAKKTELLPGSTTVCTLTNPIRAGLATLAVAASLVAVPFAQAAKVPAGAGSGAVAPIAHKGRWFVDATGRVVQLRGVNEVYKTAPYYPAADGFGADDVNLLSKLGLNVVRLGVDLRGLMPTPGKIETAYIDKLAQTVNQLTKAGIYTQVDIHQDGYAPKYNGNGFPDWMAIDDGLPNPDLPFPVYYFGNTAMQRAWDHFWDNSEVNGKGLQEYVIQSLTALVKKFRGNPHVVGYDVFNEPWPGTDFAPCAEATGCPQLERELMMPFARKAVKATRKLTKTQPVFVEPFLFFNLGRPTVLPGSTGAWLSAHNYATDENDALMVKETVKAATRDQVPAILTEFGATSDNATIDRLTSIYDARIVSWIFWAYNENVVPDGSVTAGTGTATQDVIQALARPYPVAVTGTPTSLKFDPDTRVMDLTYGTAKRGGGKFPAPLPSVVSVPRYTYPTGYKAIVKGARVTSAACSPKLRLQTRPGARKVSLTVKPASSC